MGRKKEVKRLKELEHDLHERLGGDPYVEYCEKDDLRTEMERAADQARLKVVQKRLAWLAKMGMSKRNHHRVIVFEDQSRKAK